MVKEIFLEYKFGDYDLNLLKNSGATGFIAWIGNLTLERWEKLQELNIDAGICIAGTRHGICPLDPKESKDLTKRIEEALSYKPTALWIDHIRFDGYWEGIKEGQIPDVHQPCHWCKGKNRVAVIKDIAQLIKIAVGGRCQLGYFAVPFKPEEVPLLTLQLGQNHKLLSGYFDIISPMLYHRMIGKPIGYNSEYTNWLSLATRKPIIPIIQVKDMPDNLPDRLSDAEMESAYQEAIKEPSIGVIWFSWDGAVEKNKTEIISRLFKS